MLALLFGWAFAIIGFVTALWLMGPVNKAFSLIWEDPRDREAKEALARVKELHIDQGVPEATAVVIAASEKQATEKEVLDAIGAVNPSDVAAMLKGRRTAFGTVFGIISKAFRQ